MLRESKGARRYRDLITLTKRDVITDELGHASFGEPHNVTSIYASVIQMSATKTMLTFQQADIVGLDIEFRKPCIEFDGIRWHGHDVHFATPECVDNRGRILRIEGWYQVDNPLQQ